MKRTAIAALLLAFAAGCAKPQPPATVVVQENKAPGTVDHYWVEPMYDTVKVPGKIDSTNTYYRAGHQTVVEVRPDRFENVRYDGDKEPANSGR